MDNLIAPSFPWCCPDGGIGIVTQDDSMNAEIIDNDIFIFSYLLLA